MLAVKKAFRIVLLGAIAGLGFSLYLAHIEAKVLGVWCIYCVISLGVISLMTLAALCQVSLGLSKGQSASRATNS